jgi:hypothetical protein
LQETPQKLTLLSLKDEFVTLKNKEGNYIIFLKLSLGFTSLFGHPHNNNFCGYLAVISHSWIMEFEIEDSLKMVFMELLTQKFWKNELK